MKKISLMLAALMVFSQAAMAQSITVSATVPAATGLSLSITPVTNTGPGGTPVFGTALTTSTIPFGTLTFDSTNHIWISPTYYAVDIGTTGGAGGTPVVNVTYTEGTNPNGANGGLGNRAIATFDVVNPTVTPNTDTVSVLGSKALASLTGTAGQLPAANIPAGDFERVYVGIYTGTPTVTNVKPFTNSDVGGNYTGTLTFTAVSL